MPYGGSDFTGTSAGLLKYEQSCFLSHFLVLLLEGRFRSSQWPHIIELPLLPSFLLHLAVAQWSSHSI